MQIDRGLGIFGVHVHHEMGIGGKESHLPLRITAVGTVRVGLDEFADREPIGGFFGEIRV